LTIKGGGGYGGGGKGGGGYASQGGGEGIDILIVYNIQCLY